MCGIALNISKKNAQEVNMVDVLTSIKHRGPNASSTYEHNFEHTTVKMGHVRLSVIDVTEHANQPFVSSCGNYVLIFNGEIYNYLEIRKELEGLEVKFKTHSDTEVLLQAYIRWKENALQKLQGMYAFIVLERLNNSIVIVRDPLGIKPLYYYYNKKDGALFVASEIKTIQAMGIEPKVDTNQIFEFLLNNWLFEPKTGFRNIHKVLPGTIMVYNLKANSMSTTKFFQLGLIQEESCSISSIKSLVGNEISQQLKSDVKLGLFFSGGNDSSLIAALAGREKADLSCLVAKYNQTEVQCAHLIDDYPFAKNIAKHLNVAMRLCEFDFGTYDQNLGDIAKVVALGNEELNGDYTYLASYMIAKEARKRGYVVMLSGMGADEIFAGYPRYLLLRYYSIVKLINKYLGLFIKPILKRRHGFHKKYERLVGFINESESNFALAYSNLLGYFSFNEIQKNFLDSNSSNAVLQVYQKLNEEVQALSPLKKGMYLDSFGFLTHNFITADKSSMANGVELRVPLASSKLLKAAFNLPDKQLIRNFKTKWPLKKILNEFLKKRDVNRKKTGFNPPLDGLLRNFGYEKTRKLLHKSLSKYLKVEYLDYLVESHFKGEKNNTYKLLQLVYLSVWLSVYEKADATKK